MHDESERDIDECTADSDFMSGQEGKTPSKLNAKIADYHCKFKESRMQAIMMHRRRMEGIALQYVFATYIYLRMRFTEEEAIASRMQHTTPLGLTPAELSLTSARAALPPA